MLGWATPTGLWIVSLCKRSDLQHNRQVLRSQLVVRKWIRQITPGSRVPEVGKLSEPTITTMFENQKGVLICEERVIRRISVL
jgi:hypothetical protein